MNSLASTMIAGADEKRKRLIVKKDNRFIAVNFSEVAGFVLNGKKVSAVLQEGLQYECSETLQQLEERLDGQIFFRINRRCIVNGNYIHGFSSLHKTLLQLLMQCHFPADVCVVSQKRVARFRKWIYNL